VKTKLGILYEHPHWFELLFTELTRRGIQFERIAAERLAYDPERRSWPDLVLNRMSPSAWTRGHGNGIFAVKELLEHLECAGVELINGSRAYAVEISKAKQLDLFRKAGVGFPRGRVINHPALAFEAVKGLRYPVLVKPNIGGSGAGIVRIETPAELARRGFELGVDGTGIVQEFVPARDQAIVRIEVLDGRYLYAIRIVSDFSSFNLCPADICRVGATQVERYDPPREAIEAATGLAKMANLDIGGIEYLVDDRDGRICFYDINALSNFVADAVNVVGFDPTARFVDYIERRLGRIAQARGGQAAVRI
jgi:glutathione synthase/RimK-type ligase-like ATP-grasp enzyme